MAAAAAAGLDKDRVRVHDPASEAVQVARALDWKYPVKLQSLREEEFKSGRYRAMAAHRVRAGADARGRLTAFWQQIAAEPTSPNLPGVAGVLFKGGVDYMTTSGAVDGPYALANFKLETTNVQTGVPIMVWRSVGNSHTEFASESAIDELAIAVGRDPVDLRRDLLVGNPRTRQVRRWQRQLDASRSRPLAGIDELRGRLAAAAPDGDARLSCTATTSWTTGFLPGEHGAGLTNLQYAPLAEITARSPELAPAALNCSAQDIGNMEVLAYFGTPEQNKRWPQPLLNAEIRSAFAMTEPEVASSDATNIGSAGSFSRSARVVFPLPGPSRPRDRADCARVLPAAQCRAVGGDHTAPDTVLADIPRPQR